MLVRALLAIAFAAALTACGEKEEPDCCAIEPKSKCESELAGAGVTDAETELLMGAAPTICPSSTLSEARIRELRPIWLATSSCAQARGYDRLGALDAGLCSVRSLADAPPLPDGVDVQVATTCAAGLAARGVKETELWLVLGEPAGVCPNNGVTEQRLRSIIADDWAPAGCTQFSKDQMLHALETGACGGDAN